MRPRPGSEGRSRRRGRPAGPVAAACAVAAVASGCREAPSFLVSRGSSSASITTLGWFLSAVALLVVVVISVLVLYALFHRRDEPVDDGRLEGEEGDAERRGRRAILAGTILSAGILLVTLVWTLRVLVGYSEGLDRTDLTVRVTGYQYWWEIEYLDESGRTDFVTANELHIPVGARVKLELEAGDVIHSFWVPQLAGKTDLIPGQHNQMWISADEPGIYRGQCAEFCGESHANMLIRVIADRRAAFAEWEAAQRAPAAPDSAGLALFRAKGCAACHTIRGTDAAGEAGPDLTHFGSRSTLASGMLENTRAHVAAWLSDPDSVKPGARMPATGLQARDIETMTGFLEGLQ